MEQEVLFCTAPDGARFAYAVVGEGPPLLFIPRWMSHLELDWQRLHDCLEPVARHFRLVRYDKRGTGLSERTVSDFSLECQLRDFETLVEHLRLGRFSVYASSAGGLVALSYAALHPERVDKLVLYATFARGEGLTGRRQTTGALASLVRAEWGLASETLTDLFMPGAATEEKEAFALKQRLFAEPEVAARYLEEIVMVDVRSLLPRIVAPTLVVHAKEDRTVPYEFGLEVAAGIPQSRFLALDTNRHILPPALESQLWTAALQFLLDRPGSVEGELPAATLKAAAPDGLSDREVEVLRLIAEGKTNQQIASELFISLNTVAHHVASIFAKAGLANRAQAASYAHRNHLL
jgi:pimeloyl-ACP methyl ester carboxylesterase/DNA-binding CsgD family transcriptional regulator